MSIRTTDGSILNPRFLREIRVNDRDNSAIAIGEDGRECHLDVDIEYNYNELLSLFDVVIPGVGVILVAYRPVHTENEPTMEDIYFMEYEIVGWRINLSGFASPIATARYIGEDIELSAVKRPDGWALLESDGTFARTRRYRDRSDFERKALLFARGRWHRA